jgi:hypothetical protein
MTIIWFISVSPQEPATFWPLIRVTNAVRLARSGADAEIRCYFVSLVAVVDRQQNQTLASKPLIGQPIALLQCSAEQQQLLLLSLLKA